MSVYDQILRQFQQKFQVKEFEKYKMSELIEMTHQLAQINCGSDQLDPTIAQQIEENAPITYDKKVIVRDFVGTIQIIYNILSTQIKQTQKKLAKQTKPQHITVYRQNLEQITTYQEHLSNIFCISMKYHSKIIKKMQLQEQNEYQQSQTLNAAVVILIISLIFQLFLMIYRISFLNTLVYVFSLGIFVLNFFDRAYIRSCILALLVSNISDILWCISQSNYHLQRASQTGFSTLLGSLSSGRTVFFKFAYVATLLLMISKFSLTVILFRFRNIPVGAKKSVKLFEIKVNLQSKFANPVSKMGVVSPKKKQETESI